VSLPPPLRLLATLHVAPSNLSALTAAQQQALANVIDNSWQTV
jgi:hypothetical protein